MLNFLRRNRSPEPDGRLPVADPEPTPEERLDELFSAYLDDDLTPAERTELEARLAADGSARDAFEGMRSVRDTLATLEVVRAPRSFAIPAPPVRERRGLSRFDLVTRIGAMAASVAFVAVVAGDLSGGGTPVTDPTTFSSSERSNDAAALSADAGDTVAESAGGTTELVPKDEDATPAAGDVAADSSPADDGAGAAGATQSAPAESPTPDTEATVEAASAAMSATEEPADSAGGAGSEGSAGTDDTPAAELPERSGGAIDPPSAAPPAPDVEDPSAEYGAIAPGASDDGEAANGADAARDGSVEGDGTTDPDTALGLQSDDTSATSATADESGVLIEDGGEVSNLAIVLGSVAAVLAAASGVLWWRRRGGTAGPI